MFGNLGNYTKRLSLFQDEALMMIKMDLMMNLYTPSLSSKDFWICNLTCSRILGGITTSPLQMKKRRKNMITQKQMLPHRIQPERQLPILDVWMISQCSIHENGHLDFQASPACHPALPCHWHAHRVRVVFQDLRLSSYTSSLLCPSCCWGLCHWSGLGVMGGTGHLRHFLLKNSSGPAPCLYHQWQKACNLWGTLGPAYTQPETEERQRKKLAFTVICNSPFKGARKTDYQKGGRGFLAPHCMLGSPSPALWPGPSPSHTLTPSSSPASLRTLHPSACAQLWETTGLLPALASPPHITPHPPGMSSVLGWHPQQRLLWVIIHASVSGVSESPTVRPFSHRSAVGMTWLPGWSLVGQGSTSSRLCWLHTASCSPAVCNKTKIGHFIPWAEFITVRGLGGHIVHLNIQKIIVLYASESPS